MALLNEPDLLILDEPTVGLDPIVRKCVWSHLLDMTRTSHTTVIVTTHYVEEARSANVAGLMRSGSLLDEGPPAYLMEKHGKVRKPITICCSIHF